MPMELHKQTIGVHRRAPHCPCCLIVFSVTSITFSNENNRYCLPRREGRGCLTRSSVSDRKRQSEWRKAMRMILAATAIALTMLTSAHAGQLPNGQSLNGLWTNGVWQNGVYENGLWSNGLTQNGIWSNDIWQNGVWQNGVFQNGLVLNGRTSTADRPNAGPQAIGSANLIAIELPR